MLGTIILSAVGCRIGSSVWLWDLDIPAPQSGSRTLHLLRHLADVRPVVGYWARRRVSS
jgi:hypothetical protein